MTAGVERLGPGGDDAVALLAVIRRGQLSAELGFRLDVLLAVGGDLGFLVLDELERVVESAPGGPLFVVARVRKIRSAFRGCEVQELWNLGREGRVRMIRWGCQASATRKNEVCAIAHAHIRPRS